MHKHRIILENFDLEKGKISFSKLKELQSRLTALALPIFEDIDLKRLAKEQDW